MAVVVVSVIVMAMVVMGRRRMRVAVAVIAVMLDRVARGVASMRAEQRDQAARMAPSSGRKTIDLNP